MQDDFYSTLDHVLRDTRLLDYERSILLNDDAVVGHCPLLDSLVENQSRMNLLDEASQGLLQIIAPKHQQISSGHPGQRPEYIEIEDSDDQTKDNFLGVEDGLEVKKGKNDFFEDPMPPNLENDPSFTLKSKFSEDPDYDIHNLQISLETDSQGDLLKTYEQPLTTHTTVQVSQSLNTVLEQNLSRILTQEGAQISEDKADPPILEQINHAHEGADHILNLESLMVPEEVDTPTFRNLKRRRNQREKGKPHQTKFILPSFKRVVFVCLVRKMGMKYIKNHPQLMKIKSKNGMVMADYVTLFGIPELREVWDQFFRTKFLYREILLGKVQPQNQLINIRYAHVFERVFETGEFNYIMGPPADSGSGR